VQLNHNCLLTVTWAVLFRRVADARTGVRDPQHCWRRRPTCVPARQCTSTSRSRHSQASALWDTHFISPDMRPANSCDINPVDYRIWGMMQVHVHQVPITVWQAAVVDCWNTGWISAQHGGWCNRLMSKRTGTCIHADSGNFEHLLWHCLPEIQVATQHNSLFSQPSTFGGKQQRYTFHQMNEFCTSQGSAVIFFRCDGQAHDHGYSLFYPQITQIIRNMHE